MARRSSPVALFVAAMLVLPAVAGEKLSKRYPGKQTWSQYGLAANCSTDDVWRLSSFEFAFGKDFELAGGPATAALGVHDGHVLWALVTPDEPATIETLQAGDGETTRSIFLRFAPTEIDKVFPPKTVEGPGPGFARADAARAARHKMGWKWSTGSGNSTIVQPGWVIVDVDTLEGPRRFYALDRGGNTLEYVSDFEDSPLPPSPPIDAETALAAFDEVYAAFSEGYAGFVLLPKLDWKQLGKRYREQAAEVGTLWELGFVLGDLLAHLEDLHVWVRVGEQFVPGYNRERPLNGNWNATQKLANARQKSGDQFVWGITDDGIGYLGVHGLGDQKLPERVDQALERMAETWALIVDLRFNGGGDEIMAQQIAGRFVDRERVYSTSQYRDGPDLDDLGPRFDRTFAPRGPWRYEAPVVLLQGRKTMSSAESMALMFAQCPQVTTLGDTTAGSSANPRRIELACGITVNQPRWLDRDPEGNPIEHVGVAPKERVEALPVDFDDEHDPVLEAALKHLRRISKSKRGPARAD
ncbi:MAG TPA: S41 family peptidase [Planctomycetota bacterium]|nr:S41 family peptidase [Planctomycetota bacterium]